MTRTSPVRPAAIPLPDRATTPSFRITSASASTPRPGSMTRPPRRQRSIRPGPLDRRSRRRESMGFSPAGGGWRQARRHAANGDASRARAVAHRAEAAVDLACTSRCLRFARQSRRRSGVADVHRSPMYWTNGWPAHFACTACARHDGQHRATDGLSSHARNRPPPQMHAIWRIALARAPAGLGAGQHDRRPPCIRTRPATSRRRVRVDAVRPAAL